MDRREFVRIATMSAVGVAVGPTALGALAGCSSSGAKAGGASGAGSSTSSTGSSGGVAGGSKITLDFPSWQATETGVKDWWAEAVRNFESQNPNITINMSEVPYAHYTDTLTTRFSAGKPPEIVHLPTANFGSFASQGWLANLDDRLKGTDILGNWTDIQKTMLWNGHYVGVLLLGYAPVLYYNAKMLEDAGVAVPTTTAELVAAAKKLTQNGLFGFGATTTSFPNIYSEMTYFIYGAGGAWCKGKNLTFTDPATLKGVDNYRAAVALSPKGVTTEQVRTLFFDGKVAMLIDGPFIYSSIAKANPAVQPNIKVAKAPFAHQPGAVSNSIHIPTGISKEKADAVWKFIQSLTTPKMQADYAQMYSVPAPRKGVVTQDMIAKQPQLGLFQSVTEEAVDANPDDPKLIANFSEFQQLVVDAGVALQTTNVSTQSAMSDLQKKVAAAIKS